MLFRSKHKTNYFFSNKIAKEEGLSAERACETSAVGRALAFAGFGGGYSIASKDEVDNAKAAQTKSIYQKLL